MRRTPHSLAGKRLTQCPRCGFLQAVEDKKKCPVCSQKKKRGNLPQALHQNAHEPPPDRPALVKDWQTELHHPNPNRRSNIISTLAENQLLEEAHNHLLNMLVEDDNCFVRGHIAEILKKTGGPELIDLFAFSLGHDEHWYVRLMAVEFFGQHNTPAVRNHLIKALQDEDPSVRIKAVEMLARQGWIPETDAEHILYLFARNREDALLDWGGRAIEPLRIQIALNSIFQTKMKNILRQLCKNIHTVIFEEGLEKSESSPLIWHNPYTLKLTVPLTCLQRIEIDADTANFYAIERFLTYAVAYLGQDYLEENVTVIVKGNPDRLHPNLKNNLINLCQKVEGI